VTEELYHFSPDCGQRITLEWRKYILLCRMIIEQFESYIDCVRIPGSSGHSS
jgi:hypothetical protein